MPANMVAELGRPGDAPSGSQGPFVIGAGLAEAAGFPVPSNDSVHPNVQGRPVSFGPRHRRRDEGEDRGRSTRRRKDEDGDHHAVGGDGVGIWGRWCLHFTKRKLSHGSLREGMHQNSERSEGNLSKRFADIMQFRQIFNGIHHGWHCYYRPTGQKNTTTMTSQPQG